MHFYYEPLLSMVCLLFVFYFNYDQMLDSPFLCKRSVIETIIFIIYIFTSLFAADFAFW